MQLQKCTMRDVPKLALLNKQLILIDRKHHYGTQAFQLLLQSLNIKEIDIEVLPWNKDGLALWKHCGFHETCIAMRYKV